MESFALAVAETLYQRARRVGLESFALAVAETLY